VAKAILTHPLASVTELELVKLRGPICKMRGFAMVGDEKVAAADLMSTIVEI